MDGQVKLFTRSGEVLVAVWRLGFATGKEISEYIGLNIFRTHKLLAPLAHEGVLLRRRVAGVYVYSVNPWWVKNHSEIKGFLAAIEEAQSEGWDPRQL